MWHRCRLGLRPDFFFVLNKDDNTLCWNSREAPTAVLRICQLFSKSQGATLSPETASSSLAAKHRAMGVKLVSASCFFHIDVSKGYWSEPLAGAMWCAGTGLVEAAELDIFALQLIEISEYVRFS